jgi:hypothetical protein
MRRATFVLVAALASACGPASSGGSSPAGDADRQGAATTAASSPATSAPDPSTSGTRASETPASDSGAAAGGSGGPCGGLSRPTVEAVVGAAVSLQPGPAGDRGPLGSLVSTKGITKADTCYAGDGTNHPGGGSNYGCVLAAATFVDAARTRAAFDEFAKRANGVRKIPLALGDATYVATYTLGSYIAGVATVLKRDRLVNLTCTVGDAYPDLPKGKFHKDAFVSAVREAASQL